MRPESLEFNLVPETVTLRRRLVEKARSLTALAALVMAALVSVSMYGTLKLYLKKSRLDAVRAAIRQTEPAAKRVETMRGIVGVVAKRSDLRFSALALLTELQKALPEDVYFDRISLELDKGQVGLQGTGGSRSAVFTLIRNLEQSTLMADVKEGGPIALDKNGRFRFQLVGGLEKAE
jgi:Tfp pilus assembly protein PilN